MRTCVCVFVCVCMCVCLCVCLCAVCVRGLVQAWNCLCDVRIRFHLLTFYLSLQTMHVHQTLLILQSDNRVHTDNTAHKTQRGQQQQQEQQEQGHQTNYMFASSCQHVASWRSARLRPPASPCRSPQAGGCAPSPGDACECAGVTESVVHRWHVIFKDSFQEYRMCTVYVILYP